jgi:hypothetical protein
MCRFRALEFLTGVSLCRKIFKPALHIGISRDG